MSVGVYPPTLSLLLRHLLLSHEAYHLHKTCTSLPQTTKDVRLLSKELLPLSKDPPPLPCENPGGGSLGEWLLAVEDAQARVHVCWCLSRLSSSQPSLVPIKCAQFVSVCIFGPLPVLTVVPLDVAVAPITDMGILVELCSPLPYMCACLVPYKCVCVLMYAQWAPIRVHPDICKLWDAHPQI